MSREHESSQSRKVSLSLIGKVGDKARRWKGDKAGYVAKHSWLTKHYVKGNSCEECGTKDSKRLEWANISGKYLRERSDYKVLCTSCHRKMDLASDTCKNGHKYTPDTLYINKQGWRNCRKCRNASQRRYMEKKRA